MDQALSESRGRWQSRRDRGAAIGFELEDFAPILPLTFRELACVRKKSPPEQHLPSRNPQQLQPYLTSTWRCEEALGVFNTKHSAPSPQCIISSKEFPIAAAGAPLDRRRKSASFQLPYWRRRVLAYDGHCTIKALASMLDCLSRCRMKAKPSKRLRPERRARSRCRWPNVRVAVLWHVTDRFGVCG